MTVSGDSARTISLKTALTMVVDERMDEYKSAYQDYVEYYKY
jgi:hypothetical protein